MKFFKRSAAFALGFFFIAGVVFAQGNKMKSSKADSISDKELKKFANVTTEVQKVNRKSQMKVQSLLAEEDMEMQRFQKIMMSKRNPKLADSVKVTDKEKKTIKKLQPKLMKMQQKSQKKMMNSMKENELNPQRFKTILRAVQTDSNVAKRFQKIARDTMKEQ